MQQQYSDNPLDKQFRYKLSGSAVQPGKRVWNRIAANLEQTSRRKTIGTRLLYISLGAVAAAVIATTMLFVPGIITKTSFSKHSNVQANSARNKEIANVTPQLSSKQNVLPSKSSIVQGALIKTSIIPEKRQYVGKNGNKSVGVNQQLAKLNSNLQSTISLLNKALAQIDNSTNQREDIAPIAVTVKGLTITSDEAQHSIKEMPYVDNSNDLTASEISTSSKTNIQPSICVKGLYTGLDFALNNTWLMDKKALANYDFKYKVTLGKAVAIKIGYNFSNSFGIETGCNLISEEGQDYTFSPPVFARVEPTNLDNRVKLTYTQIPLLAKFKFAKTSGLTHHTVVLNYSLGAEYGFLHTISNTVSDENAEYANFKKSELAVVGGIGYDVYLSSKVFISTGIQVSYSSNLYNNTPVSPYDQFSAPHSFVGGIHIGINYALTGCR